MRGLEYLALMGLNPSVPTAYRDGATVFEMLGGLQSKLNEVITVVNDTFSSEDGEVIVRELVTQILSEDIKLDGYVTRVELEYATSLLGTMPIEQSYTTDQPDRYVDGYDYFIRLHFYGADDVSIGASQPLQLSRVFDYLKDAKTLNGEDFSYFASKQELNAYETVANATLKYATKQDIADLSAGLTPEAIEATGLARTSEAVKAMKLQYAVTESSTPPDPSEYSDTVPLYTVSSTLWVRIQYTMVNDAMYFTEGTSLLSDYVKLMFTHSNLNAASLGGFPAEKYELKERTKNTITGVVMQFGYSALEDSPPGTWYSARHTYDAPPNNANVWNGYNEYDAEASFLANFEEAFRNAILDTTIRVAKNTVTDGGGYEDITRKVYLLSNTEVGLSSENGVAEGSKWDLFSDNNSRKAYLTAEAASRSEYTSSNLEASSPWYWWLRTPGADSSRYALRVDTVGSLLRDGNAYLGSVGIRPALEMDSGILVSDTPDTDGAYIIQWNQPPTIPTSQISTLNVGDVVKSVNTKYNNSVIRFVIGHKTDTRVKLITEQIIALKCFDAIEASNPYSNRKQYGNNRYSVSNIDQWLNSPPSSWHENISEGGEESPYLWQRLKLIHLDGSNTFTTPSRMPKPEELDISQFATAAQGALAESALQRSEYTASDVLEKIKSVDGPDSGLDADTLDGLHGSDFATAEQGLAADGALPLSDFTANSILSKIKTVDGSGSGLDADTVDGVDSSSFVRNDLPNQLIGINPFVWGEDTYSSYLEFYGSNSNLLGMIGFNTNTSNMTLKANTGVLNLDTPNRSGGLRHNGQRVPTITWGTNPPTTGVPGQIYIKI